MFPIVIATIENDNERIFMEKIYTKYYSLMKKKALFIVDDETCAEEIVQDSILRFVDRIGEVMKVDKNKLPAYIMATVRNMSINRMKKKQFESGLFDQLDEDLYDLNELPEDLYIHKELLDRLEQTIEQLPVHYKLLLEAKYILNMKDEEIAKQFDIKTDHVRVYIMRARRKAYTMMEEDSNV